MDGRYINQQQGRMNNKELKEKIDQELTAMRHEGQLHQITLDKIMILIDQANRPSENKLPREAIYKLAEEIIEESPQIRHLIERQKWTPSALKIQAVNFIDRNYPTGGLTLKIRNHFFNWIRKQDPPKNKPKTIIDAN